jgi:hypothetical protein
MTNKQSQTEDNVWPFTFVLVVWIKDLHVEDNSIFSIYNTSLVLRYNHFNNRLSKVM